MKGSESAQVYYDYENVLSFDNVRDSVNQWNNWLMEGQTNGCVDDRQMQKRCVHVFKVRSARDWASAAGVEQKCPVIGQ